MPFKRLASFVVFGIWLLWEVVLQPVWNLNVEKWAAARSLDNQIDGAAEVVKGFAMPDWLITTVDYVTGGFLQGAATLAVVFLLFDGVSAVLARGKNHGHASRLVLLSADVFRVKQSVESFNAMMVQYPRIRTGVPQSMSVDESASIRSVFTTLNHLGISTPKVPSTIGRETGPIIADYLATIYPFIRRSQLQEAKLEAKRFNEAAKK